VESLLCIAGHRTAAQNKNPMQKKIIWVRLLSQNLNCQYSKKFKKILLEIRVKSPSIQNLGFNLFLTNSYIAKPVPTTMRDKKRCFINMLCSNEGWMKLTSKSIYCINATNRLRAMQL
jgi:hypothetical protein